MKSISLRKGDIETAEQWSAQRKPIRKYATEKGNLSDILFESILYYRKGYLDSGIYELTKGVALSEKLNDTFFRPIYLINLGSYYFSAGLFGSAVKHFTDGLNFKYHHLDNTALNISNIDEYLLIHNNLMACYIEEKEFSKVYDTYNSVKSRIKPGMGSDYTMQLLELNYLSALVLDKKLTLAEEQFQHIQVDSLLDVHQTFYQGIRGDFLVKSANNQAYRSYYQEIESELYEDPQTFLRYHADNLLYGVQNRLIDLNYQKLSSYYDSLEIGQFNYFAAILLARLLKELADYNGLHTASIRFEKAFLQHELDFQKQHDEIRLSKVNFELEKLQFQKALQKRKYEIDAINEQNKSILIISVVVIGFLVMTILWLYQKHISRRKILSIISLEKN